MKQDKPLLLHILEEIRFLRKQSKNLTFEDFLADEVFLRAFARSFEIIGEAAKKISNDLKISHPEIEWRHMTGLRDVLIHHYFGVNWDIVWDVISNKLPALESKLTVLVHDE